jgi:hypothetical protein
MGVPQSLGWGGTQTAPLCAAIVSASQLEVRQ